MIRPAQGPARRSRGAVASEASQRTEQRRRKAPIAAFLSFLFPGGGQLFNRQPLLAAVFAVPVAVLLLGGAVVAIADQTALITRLLDTRVVIALMVLNVGVLGWRLAAIVQAHRYRARFGTRRAGTWITAGLVLITILMHAVPTVYGLKFVDTLSTVALGGNRGSTEAGQRTFPGFGGPHSPPSHQPDVQEGERVTFLLIGLDSGPGRDHSLTDTMLVLSIDPDGRSAMISLPRDLVNAPLPNGEPYPGKLNSLLQTADSDPAAYPFGGGGATLKGTISRLLDVPIHYIAAVDMAGFQQLIDAVGGVEIVIHRAIADPTMSLYLEPGPVYMNGGLALQYARSRSGPGDDDFTRADRQQQLLGALREKLNRTNLLTTLPSLLDAIKNTIATDVPSERIPELAAAIQAADVGDVERTIIQPPDFVTPATAVDGAYVLLPDLELIRELGQQLMGD